MFDLDDARAHVGREHRAVGTRQDAREIDDGESGEGRFRHNLSVMALKVTVFTGDT